MSSHYTDTMPENTDFSLESEFGDLIEVEVGNPTEARPRRYIINVLARGDGLSQMFITDDLNKIKIVRDKLNEIITTYDKST